MNPHRWIIAGRAFLAATVVLAALSAVLALDAVSGIGFRILIARPAVLGPVGHIYVEFLGGVICGVLAGATFFSGLACFFWGALLASRQQLARLLEALQASAGTGAARTRLAGGEADKEAR